MPAPPKGFANGEAASGSIRFGVNFDGRRGSYQVNGHGTNSFGRTFDVSGPGFSNSSAFGAEHQLTGSFGAGAESLPGGFTGADGVFGGIFGAGRD